MDCRLPLCLFKPVWEITASYRMDAGNSFRVRSLYGMAYGMIHIDPRTMGISGDDPAEVEKLLCNLAQPITDQEMADMVGRDLRTVQRWKQEPAFPRTESGRVTRLAFVRYLLNEATT